MTIQKLSPLLALFFLFSIREVVAHNWNDCCKSGHGSLWAIENSNRIRKYRHLNTFLKENIHLWLDARPLMTVQQKVKLLSCVRLFATAWTVAHQAPPSLDLSRQEYWSRLPLPSPGDLPSPGIEPRSPALQADTLLSKPQKIDELKHVRN